MIEEAIKFGACAKTLRVETPDQMAELFFSPQGIEFCQEHSFPSLWQFRNIDFDTEKYGVYIDKEVELENQDVALIHSKGKLKFSGVDKSYKVILMHGSECEIEVSNYAVVKLEGQAKIINDGTGVVL